MANRSQAGTEGPASSWYRGNLHMHSFWSDGHHFPEMVAKHFKEAGYHFIAFTEHDRFQVGEKWIPTAEDTPTGRTLRESGFLGAYRDQFGEDWVEIAQRDGQECVRLKPLAEYRELLEEPERFLILNGEEVTTKSRDTAHWINVINAPEPIGGIASEGASFEAMNQTAARAAEMERASASPILVSLNHPNYVWNATAEDVAAASAIGVFEIHTALNCTFSYGDEVHPGAERIWDIVLAKRLSQPGARPVYGIATDDCHVYHRSDSVPAHEQGSSMPCRAWVMVRAAALTPDALVEAMKNGDFYASTGVSLRSVEADGSGLRLQIEPEPGVEYTTRFIGTCRGTGLVGTTLAEATGTEPSYQFAGDELYVRAAITSSAPHPNPTVPGDAQKAWTQPVVP